ncbi:MAG: hypothetical protein HN348_31530, partial [Proteobacteria bacterium]|nr:hypothetical protein [Pseudomonadota bacterium]
GGKAATVGASLFTAADIGDNAYRATTGEKVTGDKISDLERGAAGIGLLGGVADLGGALKAGARNAKGFKTMGEVVDEGTDVVAAADEVVEGGSRIANLDDVASDGTRMATLDDIGDISRQTGGGTPTLDELTKIAGKAGASKGLGATDDVLEEGTRMATLDDIAGISRHTDDAGALGDDVIISADDLAALKLGDSLDSSLIDPALVKQAQRAHQLEDAFETTGKVTSASSQTAKAANASLKTVECEQMIADMSDEEVRDSVEAWIKAHPRSSEVTEIEPALESDNQDKLRAFLKKQSDRGNTKDMVEHLGNYISLAAGLAGLD